MEIRLIGTDADYKEALTEIDRLWDAQPGTPDEARLELLAMLVHNYERSLEPLPPFDAIEAIKFRLSQQGLSRKALLPVFKTTARISEVLTGRRGLTLDMIRKLHATFAIPLETLIFPSAVPKRKKKHDSRPEVSGRARRSGRAHAAHRPP